jgi:acyl-CoA synthetase (AMP-forming)/AMP-acid ligase II
MAGDALPDLLARTAAQRGPAPFLTFLDHRSGTTSTLSWTQADDAVDTVAAWTLARTAPGDRVAVLAPHGLDWVIAFLGVLRARRIAVPLHSPRFPVTTARLAGVLRDCAPALCLTTRADLGMVREFVAGLDTAVAAVDDLPPVRCPTVVLDQNSVAYLQYASETGGVMITHGNVVANARQVVRACDAGSVAVSWLPLFHAMGLVLAVAAPVAHGMRAVLMDPVAFLERPVRWLRALAAYQDTVTAAPNFAYGLTSARVTDAERAGLDLSGVRAMINGAEPVAPATIDWFHRTFAACGLRQESHRVSYVLAEATMLISATPPGRPRRMTADRRSLDLGLLIPSDAGVTLVSSGRPAGQDVRIVAGGEVLPDGRVGEVWVWGQNVGAGYWGDPVGTAATFDAALTGHPGRWLRTGDLGGFHDGELYVTSRTSDVIALDGHSHHPRDIESVVESAHPAIRQHHVAAVAVPGPAGDRVVVLAERSRWVARVNPAEVVAAVRGILAELPTVELVLLEPGALPMTSTGTVSRAASRKAYLDGVFSVGGGT